MAKLRYLLVVCSFALLTVSVYAVECVWTPAEGQITETCGKIGVGTSSIGAGKLEVFDATDGTMTVIAKHYVAVESNPASPQNDYGLWVTSQEDVYSGVNNTGKLFGTRTDAFNVGNGTVSETIGITTFSGIFGGSSTTNVGTAYGQKIWIYKGSGTVGTGYGIWLGDVEATNAWGVYQTGVNDSNYFAGKVGIGLDPLTPQPQYQLHVKGDTRIDGTLTGTIIQAQYQDVAEWVPATSDMTPGTVVVLNPDRVNEVMPSSRAYDTAVAGVVSAQPGVILGVAADSKEQIATTGRVRVKVDATAAPIRIGDLLVSSNKSGLAMKSQPAEVGGVLIHRPGTIIGKALEPLPNGEGEILVLLSLQ